MAAEIGTRKVINEHSTIGLVVTTDGSISDIPREEYEEAEERVIGELQEIHKPFVVLLNCMDPTSERAGPEAAAGDGGEVRRAGAGRSTAWIWTRRTSAGSSPRCCTSSRCGRSPCEMPRWITLPARRTTGCAGAIFDSVTRSAAAGASAISGTLPAVPSGSVRHASMSPTRRMTERSTGAGRRPHPREHR